MLKKLRKSREARLRLPRLEEPRQQGPPAPSAKWVMIGHPWMIIDRHIDGSGLMRPRVTGVGAKGAAASQFSGRKIQSHAAGRLAAE